MDTKELPEAVKAKAFWDAVRIVVEETAEDDVGLKSWVCQDAIDRLESCNPNVDQILMVYSDNLSDAWVAAYVT